MKKTISITLLAITLFMSTACQPTADPAASIDLAGTSWILSSLGGNAPMANTVVTLQFGDDGTVAG
jgi:hypothetical protein